MDCCDKRKERDEDEKKKLNNRIKRVIGQLNGVSKMIDEDRYCIDILTQLSAATQSLKSLSSLILNDHMHSCVKEGIEKGNDKLLMN